MRHIHSYSLPITLIRCRLRLFVSHLHADSSCCGPEFRSISTLCCAGSAVVFAFAVDEVFGLYHVASFFHAVEIVVCGIVFWSYVCAVVVAAELLYGLHASGATVGYLHKVEVAESVDGDSRLHS